MSGYRSGRMCKVYIDPMGAGVGTYAQLLVAKNPQLGFEWDEALVEDYASVFKRYLKGLVDAPISLEVNVKVGDTQWEALRDAAIDPDDFIGLAIATGDMTTVGETVFEADVVITQFPFDMPIGDTVTIALEARIAANSTFVPTLSKVTI